MGSYRTKAGGQRIIGQQEKITGKLVDKGFSLPAAIQVNLIINCCFMYIPLRPLSDAMLVSTMHVLADGEIISSREAFEKVQQRFTWADRKTCIERILLLKSLTHDGKKSVIVYYEAGHLVKEHINVETSFQPLNFA